MYSHRDLCKVTAEWLLGLSGIDLVSFELRWNRGVVDAIGTTSKERTKSHRIVIAEVKRTRADLLQDLRRSKMLKYQAKATHCYLAATREALKADKLTPAEILADLQSKGLPICWGVVLLPGKPGGSLRTLRNARKIKPMTHRTCKLLTRKIARSYMYRIFSDKSPIEI